ncbi:MAG: hypothetical protein QNK40_11470 [Desulfobacterales bacterium]|nr:hypothetical protein [Desulfobacterales bacterium]
MKKNILIIFVLLGIFIIIYDEKKYRVVEMENPAFIKNTAFNYSEDLTSPKFRKLINKYQLDAVFNGETDEFKRMLLLRHWIKTVIKIEDHGDP